MLIHLLHISFAVGCFSSVQLPDNTIYWVLVIAHDFTNWTVEYPTYRPSPDDNLTDELVQIDGFFDVVQVDVTGNHSNVTYKFDPEVGPSDSTSIPAWDDTEIAYRFFFVQCIFVVICLLVAILFLFFSCRRCVGERLKKLCHRRKKKKTGESDQGKPQGKTKHNVYERIIRNGNTNTESSGDTKTGKNGRDLQTNGILSKNSTVDVPGKRVVGPEETPIDFHSWFSADHSLPVDWFQDGQTFDVPILMYLYVYFTLGFGLESSLGKFLWTFAENIQSAADIDAASLLSTFLGMIVIGRLLALSLSRVLPPNGIMVACLTTNVLAGVVLSAYGDKYHNIMWFFVVALGGFIGPILPGGLTWSNAFLSMAPKSIALAYCSASFGCTICSWLSGIIINYFSAPSLMFLVAGISSVSIILYIPVMVKLGAPGNRKGEIKKPVLTYV